MNKKRKTLLVTGANRGLGLEFAKQFAALEWRVLACCRTPKQAEELHALARHYETVSIYPLDVDCELSIKELANTIGDQPIDILLNNAGIWGPKQQNLGQLNQEGFLQVFRTNTVAPFLLSQQLFPNVASSSHKLIAIISSYLGSIHDIRSGGMYAYRASKAAVNAIVKTLAWNLRDKGIVVVALHPGWVKTAMGGERALLTPEESVSSLSKLLLDMNLQWTGKFISFEGKELPW